MFTDPRLGLAADEAGHARGGQHAQPAQRAREPHAETQ